MRDQVIEALADLEVSVSPNCIGVLGPDGAHKSLVHLKSVLKAAERQGWFQTHTEALARRGAHIITVLVDRYGTQQWLSSVQPLVREVCEFLVARMYLWMGISQWQKERSRLVHLTIIVLEGFGVSVPHHLKRNGAFTRYQEARKKEFEDALEEVKSQGKQFLETVYRLGSGEIERDAYQQNIQNFQLIDELERLAMAGAPASPPSPHGLQLETPV